MRSGELIQLLEKRAKEYRVDAVPSIDRNSHMNAIGGECRLTQDEIDAVLTDYINYVAFHFGIDYGMYARDLASDKKEC
jgi:hypothetical protein